MNIPFFYEHMLKKGLKKNPDLSRGQKESFIEMTKKRNRCVGNSINGAQGFPKRMK